MNSADGIEWDQLLDTLSLKDHDGSEYEFGEEYDAVINLYKDSGLRKIFLQWMFDLKVQQARDSTISSKSVSVALSYREKGNDLFKIGNYAESLHCYNFSINVTPKTHENYSIALSNRSAVLLYMQKYKECLQDIDLSLASGYPDKYWHKIYLRQAECYYHLGDSSQVQLSCERAIEYLHKYSQLSKKSIADIHMNITATSEKVMESNDLNVLESAFTVDQLPKFDSKNEVLEGASPSLDLRYSKEFGRHVVTNKDVKRGDVLFVEKPFAFVALPGPVGKFYFCCENCLLLITYPIPCSVCIYSQYCSEACRIEGWDKFHRWECAGSTLMLWPKIGIAHLSIRLLLIASHDGFMLKESKKLKAGNEYTAQQVFTCMKNEMKQVKEPRGYQKTFQLLTNFEKMNKKDFKQYALTSVLLTNYLRERTEFFESHFNTIMPFEMEQDEAELLVACLILRHLGQLVANGHAVTDIHDMDTPSLQISYQYQERLGTAIYPSVSMLNHSCEPNIINSHFMDYLIVKATCDIPKGSEVFNCYGPHYRRSIGKKRRAELEDQYYFKCKCSACTNTEKDNFYSLFEAFLCQSCQGPIFKNSKGLCNNCGVVEKDISKLKSLHKKSIQTWNNIEFGDISNMITHLKLVLGVQQKCLYKYHTDIRNTAVLIGAFQEKMYEFDCTIKVFHENLPAIKCQFGEDSIEVAHELTKLAHLYIQILVNSKDIGLSREVSVQNCRDMLTEALKLCMTYYGPWTTFYTETCQKFQMCKQFY